MTATLLCRSNESTGDVDAQDRLRLAAVRTALAVAALVAAAGCTPLSYPGFNADQPRPVLAQGWAGPLERLAYDLTPAAPGTTVLNAPPGSNACGVINASVIRSVFAEQVLFPTGSAEPVPQAAAVFNHVADSVRRDAPGLELTVLGHTDSVGSDEYNMDLSRRRALRVMRALVAGGLDANRLSAVAIGRRQPIADNATVDGRAKNRRVEVLISGCLAANLNVVRERTSAGGNRAAAVDVLRLDPSSRYGLATVGVVGLRQPAGDQPVAATIAPARPVRSLNLRPAAGVARPAPAPHYQPRTLSPDAQLNPLGPAVPF